MVAKCLDLNKLGPASMAGKKRKHCNNDLPVHDCTQEQNDSSNFSSIVRQRKWPSLSRKIVEIQKFGYHGKVTSHVSFLLL